MLDDNAVYFSKTCGNMSKIWEKTLGFRHLADKSYNKQRKQTWRIKT